MDPIFRAFKDGLASVPEVTTNLIDLIYFHRIESIETLA